MCVCVGLGVGACRCGSAWLAGGERGGRGRGGRGEVGNSNNCKQLYIYIYIHKKLIRLETLRYNTEVRVE